MLGVSATDALVTSPLAFLVGVVVGYRLRRLRTRYRLVRVNGRNDERP
jgi:hypothetical protein